MNWSDEKRRRFARELQTLFDTYDITWMDGMSAGYQWGDFVVASGTAQMRKVKSEDRELVNNITRELGIEYSLRNGDKEAFMKLTAPPQHECVDCKCDLELRQWFRCVKCSKKMCATCYHKHGHVCIECQYEEDM